MFPNLKAEMARYGFNYARVAATVGRSGVWLDAKLRGKGYISIQEALCIRNALFPNLSIEYLFSVDPVEPQGTINAEGGKAVE